MAVTAFGGGSNANLSFGSATGPSTDSLTAALFPRVSASAGAYLQGSLNGFTSGSDPSYLLEAWFLSNQTQAMGIAQLDDASGNLYLQLSTSATGKLVATYTSLGTAPTSITSSA